MNAPATPDKPTPAKPTRSEMEIKIKTRAAFFIVTFAALLAFNTQIGGSNSSKIMANTIAANNQWAWYQAKNVRSVVYKTTADLVDDKKLAQHYHGEAKRMHDDMDEIQAKAKALEADRDRRSALSPYFTFAGLALQIAIVLSTAAILAVFMPLFYGSVAVGSLGVVLFSIGYLGV
jgi:ABC-type multidrug transport system fused ATPase/permease subunit